MALQLLHLMREHNIGVRPTSYNIVLRALERKGWWTELCSLYARMKNEGATVWRRNKASVMYGLHMQGYHKEVLHAILHFHYLWNSECLLVNIFNTLTYIQCVAMFDNADQRNISMDFKALSAALGSASIVGNESVLARVQARVRCV
jgi:pentatricopeptide repeat protein